MAETTIEWTATRLPDGTVLPGYTFNPWIGCTAVSPACDNCYAETQNSFRKWNPEGWGAHAARKRTSAAYWKKPLAWNREAERTGIRRKVFCASLADVFDNHKSIDPQWRLDLFELISETPYLDWLLLTKRPQNIKKMLPIGWEDGVLQSPFENVWLGTTVENQEEADRRIPHLLSVPAKVRFLSMEPLLGPVDLFDIRWPSDRPRFPETDDISDGRSALHMIEGTRIDWVITGGESGKNARPSDPDWFRSIRDQCAAAGVNYFHKQNGEYAPNWYNDADGNKIPGTEWIDRMGKKAAGRLLDGIEHNGMPE